MAHMIEQFADGTAAFVEARTRLQAWHRLGTVTEGAMTAEEVLRLASLDNWNVRKIPLTGTHKRGGEITKLKIPGFYATVRDNPKTGAIDPLGVVGSKYTPMQNEHGCEFLNTMLDVSGAHYQTGGSLRGGRQVFVTMKLPDSIQIAGIDQVDLYIAATNAHDGSGSFTIMITPIRIVCKNTLDWALQGTRRKISFPHLPGAKDRIIMAKESLGILYKHTEAFQQDAERLLNETMTMAQLKAVCDEIWPLKEDAKTRGKNNNAARLATVEELFEDADTQRNIRGTRWAGLQAIGEYVDFYAPAPDADVRATRVLVGGAEALKQKAHKLISTF